MRDEKNKSSVWASSRQPGLIFSPRLITADRAKKDFARTLVVSLQ